MQITFDFHGQRISIDGDGPELIELLTLARDIAPKLSSINITTQVVEKEKAPERISNGAGVPKLEGNSNQTMRQFVRSMELSNISERIAAIAYYQKHFVSIPNMSPKDLEGLFIQCGFQKPGNMPVAVFDAKRKYGFMESASHGSWRISNQGENLILGKIEAGREAGSE